MHVSIVTLNIPLKLISPTLIFLSYGFNYWLTGMTPLKSFSILLKHIPVVVKNKYWYITSIRKKDIWCALKLRILMHMLIWFYNVSLLVFIDGMSTADLMQPGLVPLQPNLDDLMDYDPIQGRQLLIVCDILRAYFVCVPFLLVRFLVELVSSWICWFDFKPIVIWLKYGWYSFKSISCYSYFDVIWCQLCHWRSFNHNQRKIHNLVIAPNWMLRQCTRLIILIFFVLYFQILWQLAHRVIVWCISLEIKAWIQAQM